MPLKSTVRVTANKDSAQVYFPKPLATDSQFPFEPGDEAQAFVVPSGAVLLYPSDPPWEWPLDVRDPETVVTDGSGLPAVTDTALDDTDRDTDTETMHTTDS